MFFTRVVYFIEIKLPNYKQIDFCHQKKSEFMLYSRIKPINSLIFDKKSVILKNKIDLLIKVKIIRP